MSGEVKDQPTKSSEGTPTVSIDSSSYTSEKESSSGGKTLDTVSCTIDLDSKTEITTQYPRLVVHYSNGDDIQPPCFKYQTDVANVYCVASKVQFKNQLNDSTITSARFQFCEHQEELIPPPEPCARCQCNGYTFMRYIRCPPPSSP